MADITCKSEIPNAEGLPPTALTVGRHIILNCEGQWNKSFDFTKATFKTNPNEKSIVKVLKAEAKSINSFNIDMTLYSAGQYKFPSLDLTDGTNEIVLGPQQFQVTSVLEKTEDGKPPPPFGPILPLKLVWPPIYFILFLILVGTAITLAVLKVRRRIRLKRLIEGLKQHDSPQSPDLQFYKTMRALEKKEYPLDELELTFRTFSLRIYQVPLFELNNGQALRFMKKRRPQFKKQRATVQKFLEEFEELVKRKETVTKAERNELAKKLYRFIDQQEVLRNQAGLV